MTARRKVATLLLLLLAAVGWCIVISRPRWLMPYGRDLCRPTCDRGKGVPLVRGDVFVCAPSVDIQLAVVSPKSQVLGRCKHPSIHSCIRVAVHREAEPSVQCTSM
jgi:hypothetical protein